MVQIEEEVVNSVEVVSIVYIEEVVVYMVVYMVVYIDVVYIVVY